MLGQRRRRGANITPHLGQCIGFAGMGPHSTFQQIYLYILFIETYLYRVDTISSQAIFHMCPL